MKYKVGEWVRVRADLEINEIYGGDIFVEPMGKFRGSLVCIQDVHSGYSKYRIKGSAWNWTEEMFEPAPQFSSGIISLSNDPRLSDIIENAESERKITSKGYPILEQIDSETIKITDCLNKETRYRWDGCKWNEVRDTPTRGKSVFKPMISALEKCIRLAVESEFGTKKSTGIESRKDIRKRLLKL